MSKGIGKTIELLRNRNFILSLAIVLGLLLDQGTYLTEKLVIPALAFIMMLSTTSVTENLFRSPRQWVIPFLTSIIMNFVVLGGLILILSELLMLEETFRIGFIILAAVPPAVAVIPFTSILNLGALIITPLLLTLFLGSGFDYQSRLLITMVELIIIPLIFSRILLYTGVASRIASIKGSLVNWSFFVVIYTIVGVNREVFLNQPVSLIPVIVISATITFLLGYVIENVGKFLRIDPKRVTSLILFGTSKNAGFAAGLALALFNEQVAIPSTIKTIFMLSYIILLDLKRR
jgi:BASS family bile acid:Na+ symporter